jgi:uncharacterized membrane protein YfcA
MELLLLVGAGVVAGAVNAAVGSGTLLTYPLLLAYGLPPVVANGTNSAGLAPGNLFGAWGYRREMAGRRREVVPLAVAVGSGAVVGALLVVVLPATVFERVVPWFILVAVTLVVVGPRITALLNARGLDPTTLPRRVLLPLLVIVGLYAGYFGAAQGVIIVAALTVLFDVDVQRSNAVKNVLQGVSNGVAAVVFAIAGVVAWAPALALAVGASVGGAVGAPVARRLPAVALRALIVVVGVAAAVISFARM